jgi:hypothetical protein
MRVEEGGSDGLFYIKELHGAGILREMWNVI